MTTDVQPLTVTASELASSVSAVLDRVAAGERVAVTRHGTVVAVLVPVTETEGTGADLFRVAEATAPYAAAAQRPSPAADATALGRLVGTPAMRAVMALFFTDATLSLHQREIARRADLGLRSAQVALGRLATAGLLVSRRDGNRLYYTAARTEAFDRLRTLVSREMGVAEVIARHLRAAGIAVRYACVFGSVAAGTDAVGSDVDLLVVSDASADALVAPIAEAQRELGRDIDLVHYSADEFARRRAAGNHFVKALLAQERIDVIGTADDA